MTFRGQYGIHYETALNRDYATLSTNGNGQFIRCSPVETIVPYETQVKEILKARLPMECIENIFGFSNEMCFNKVFMILNDIGMMRKCHQLHDSPITVRRLLDLFRLHTYCHIRLVNGSTMYLIPPTGRVQREATFFVKVDNSNVFISTNALEVNRNCSPSMLVHGNFKDLGKTARYYKYMELLFDYFGHDGSMSKVYRPDKANLNRTQYELLMICLKREYTRVFNDKQFYWKIDKKRIPRVLKIENLFRDKIDEVGLTETIKLPDVPVTRLFKKLKVEETKLVLNPKLERVMEQEERRLMKGEDINTLDPFPGYETVPAEKAEWKFILTPAHEEMLKKTPYRYAKVKKKDGTMGFKILERPFVIKEEHGNLKEVVRKAFIDFSLKLEKRYKAGKAVIDEKGYEVFPPGKNPRSAVHPPQLTLIKKAGDQITKGEPVGVWKKQNEKHLVQGIFPSRYNKVEIQRWVKNEDRITKEELGKQMRDKWQNEANLRMSFLLAQVTPMQEYIIHKPRKVYNKHFHESKPVSKMSRIDINHREMNRWLDKKHGYEVMKKSKKALKELYYVENPSYVSDNFTLRMYNYAFFVATGIKSLLMLPPTNVREIICQMQYHIRDISTAKTKKWRVKKSEREVYVRFFEMITQD
jgi:hypothetical protein